jgi:glutamyl-tRNA synthetase
LRDEDIDRSRSRPEFVDAFLEDLAWLGLTWQEGPYHQSRRLGLYQEALERLRSGGFIYPCRCTRKEILAATSAPHHDDEPLYPGTCRERPALPDLAACWRFRVPSAEITFVDGHFGPQSYTGGQDFGDFVVWRADWPSYQLACVVDDALMDITEVVRGQDLLLSTARQILLYRALGYSLPAFFHCPLMLDEQGRRLAKRHDSLSLRELRHQGRTPEDLFKVFLSPEA